MARPKKEKPNRTDGMYEVKVTIGKDVQGKVIRKSFYSSVSKADAQKKAQEYIVDLESEKRTGIAELSQSITFAEWAYKWLETYKKPTVSENSYKDTYYNSVHKHIVPYFSKARLVDIKPLDVQNFYNIKGKELSESMMKKLKLCLNAIFDTAIDNDLCYKNPAKNVNFVSEIPKKEKKVYTEEQIKVAKSYFIKNFPPAYLLLDVGLRKGELIGLMWTDINFENKTLKVDRSAQRVRGQREPKLVPPKWKSYRTIPLSTTTVELLKTWKNKSSYVFCNENNQIMSVDGFTQRLETAMAHMNQQHTDVPVLSAHELRHTCGTQHRRNGVDIYTIQKLMGHKDINITANIYVHEEVEETRKAAKIE